MALLAATSKGANPKDSNSAHLLRPGDVLEIAVYEHPELTLKTRVDSDGSILFPLCGKVQTAGLPAGAISSLLSGKLQKANIERAQVFVFVSEYTPRYVYVLGEVASGDSKALEIPPEGRMSALQAVSAAGGFSPKADLRNVFVLRGKAGPSQTRVSVNVQQIMSRTGLAADVLLQPGDTVIVPSAKPVSIFGMVNQPGAFEIDTANTVSIAEIISRGGGFKEGADRDRTLLMRTDPDGKITTTVIKAGELMNGNVLQAPQVLPGDVIMATARDKIFVLGKVLKAGAFSLQPGITMTVSRAIAVAGGFDKLAAEGNVLLVRDNKVNRIDLDKVFRKNGELKLDLPLQAGDIVFVSESRW
jgi:polysaccharide export outer membrane protein